MTKIVDARGLSCPQPVLLTKQALKETDELITIVDNSVAQENVTRLAKKEGCTVQVEEKQEGTFLHLTRTSPPTGMGIAGNSDSGVVIVIPGETMGRGSEELGDVLIRSFFHTLIESHPYPKKIVFFNSGVKLVTKGSLVLDDIQTLEQRGTDILVCGTCLQYYDIKDQIVIGSITNMYEITETLLEADKLITI